MISKANKVSFSQRASAFWNRFMSSGESLSSYITIICLSGYKPIRIYFLHDGLWWGEISYIFAPLYLLFLFYHLWFTLKRVNPYKSAILILDMSTIIIMASWIIPFRLPAIMLAGIGAFVAIVALIIFLKQRAKIVKKIDLSMLDTFRKMTDKNGIEKWSQWYYPFGEPVGGGYNTHKFTGKEWDVESDLYYFCQRYYDSNIGRFISLDPLHGLIEFPQSQMRYGYCINNPLAFIDPLGLQPPFERPKGWPDPYPIPVDEIIVYGQRPKSRLREMEDYEPLDISFLFEPEPPSEPPLGLDPWSLGWAPENSPGFAEYSGVNGGGTAVASADITGISIRQPPPSPISVQQPFPPTRWSPSSTMPLRIESPTVGNGYFNPWVYTGVYFGTVLIMTTHEQVLLSLLVAVGAGVTIPQPGGIITAGFIGGATGYYVARTAREEAMRAATRRR